MTDHAIPCTNPAHGVKYHHPGSVAARECARGATSATPGVSNIPAPQRPTRRTRLDPYNQEWERGHGFTEDERIGENFSSGEFNGLPAFRVNGIAGDSSDVILVVGRQRNDLNRDISARSVSWMPVARPETPVQDFSVHQQAVDSAQFSKIHGLPQVIHPEGEEPMFQDYAGTYIQPRNLLTHVDGMTISKNTGYTKWIDSEGNPVAPGTEGGKAITDINHDCWDEHGRPRGFASIHAALQDPAAREWIEDALKDASSSGYY